MDEVKIDKRTKEYKDSIKAFEDGVNIGKEVDLEVCMEPGCTNRLEPRETPRVIPEPCEKCIWKNY
jgi:hypothetical protein